MAKTKINKLEGAQKQIDAAIRMLFRNEDPVAIYPIAAASLQVLRDLARARGITIGTLQRSKPPRIANGKAHS